MSRARILVVDDEFLVRESLTEWLRVQGFEASSAGSFDEACRLLRAGATDVVVTDLRMPKRGGIELIEACQRAERPVPVVAISGSATVSEAVQALKSGAIDLIEKPFAPQELLPILERALKNSRAPSGAATDPGSRLVGGAPALLRVLARIDQVAPTNATVLLRGESGTGKELAARTLHECSLRRAGPFLTVNCAAIPHELFESELFGHCRGSFTGATNDRVGRFEEAQGGTLVLDEIGTLTPDTQSKLLRVLDSLEYQRVGESNTRRADVRLIASTNEDLEASCRRGSFRQDLYYRLNVFPIEMPPLRDRLEDIPLLAEHLVRGFTDAPALGEEVLAALTRYAWPGNVRELKNVLERAHILSRPGPIEPGHLMLALQPAALQETGERHDLHLRRNLEAFGRELLVAALSRTRGSKSKAAELLGIDARNMGYYLRKYDLVTEEPQAT